MRVLVILLLSAVIVTDCQDLLTVEYEWKYLDFIWNSPEHKQEAINSGDYDPKKCVPYDVDRAEDGRTFVTIVRTEGVPDTLATVTNETGESGRLLHPYPDWSWHKPSTKLRENCSRQLTCVYRVAIKCNHMFVLDSGKIDEKPICPPQLFIFNLSNDELVKRVEIPDKVATNNGTGLLVTPIVHVHNPHHRCEKCKNFWENTVVFIADTEGNGIIVWQAQNNTFCRYESDYMRATDPYFTIANDSFVLGDGILPMTFTNEELFYAPLAGNEIYKMEESDLTGKCPLSRSETNERTKQMKELSAQTGPMASKDCTLFYSNTKDTSLLCLDIDNPNNTAVIARDPEKLQFVSGMKVKNNIRNHRNNQCKSNGKLMTMSNRVQKVFIGNAYNLNETNFRISTIDLCKLSERNPNCFNSCKNHHFPDDCNDDNYPGHHHDDHDDHDNQDDHDDHPGHHHDGHHDGHRGGDHCSDHRPNDDRPPIVVVVGHRTIRFYWWKRWW